MGMLSKFKKDKIDQDQVVVSIGMHRSGLNYIRIGNQNCRFRDLDKYNEVMMEYFACGKIRKPKRYFRIGESISIQNLSGETVTGIVESRTLFGSGAEMLELRKEEGTETVQITKKGRKERFLAWECGSHKEYAFAN